MTKNHKNGCCICNEIKEHQLPADYQAAYPNSTSLFPKVILNYWLVSLGNLRRGFYQLCRHLISSRRHSHLFLGINGYFGTFTGIGIKDSPFPFQLLSATNFLHSTVIIRAAHAPGGGRNSSPNFFAISITRGMPGGCCNFIKISLALFAMLR
jgi:hypothetical protein